MAENGRVKKQVMKADDYHTFDSTIEHAYHKPGMYLGSTQEQERESLVFDFETETLMNKLISFPPAMESLFVEVTDNASDNVIRSRRNKVDPGKVTITMEDEVISVYNEGTPIPIELDKKRKDKYIPEVIFGTVYSSSEYKGERHGAGTNGLGVKLVNIFSEWFEIEIGDDYNGLLYKQRWESKTKEGPGMTVRNDPVIEEYTGHSYIKVTFKLIFSRFGMEKWPKEAYESIYRRCIDLSLYSMVEVTFNDDTIDFSNILDYAHMIYGDELPNYFIHYEWPDGTEITRKKDGTEVAKDKFTAPLNRSMVLDTPYESHNMTFVNGKYTPDGGDHVTALIKTISGPLLSSLNEEKSSGKEKGKVSKLTIKELRPHVSLILLFATIDPEWQGQTKGAYWHDKKKYGPIKFDIPEKKLNKMKEWDIADALLATMENRELAKLSRKDGKKKAHIDPFKGQDANWAGTKKSNECYLLLVEGSSAAKFADAFICGIKARDYMGTFELRGKLLNVMKASKKKIFENPELQSLKEVLGLREGMDYATEGSTNTLRYGAGVVILTDADTDGSHIKALVINYFYCRFPSLLENGYITWLSTPIIKVTKGKKAPLKFYSLGQFEEWRKDNPKYGGKVEYYKGLGTNTNEEVKEEAADPKYVDCVYDEEASEHIKLAFCGKLANKRKEWIRAYEEIIQSQMPTEVNISDFINRELVEYSIYNIKRSIPCWDGLKPSQRKILWASSLEWNWFSHRGGKKRNYEKAKVATFGSLVSAKTDYHHGEKSLFEAIVGMAQNFVGTNNLPHFVPLGQFGDRTTGPKKHAAERYIFTVPQWWLPYVYREEDLGILSHEKSDQGKDIEPTFFLPILPTILINGSDGIATGWSTYIPPHNVIDIINWYKSKLAGYKSPPIEPWFRNFKGKVIVYDRNKSGKKGYYEKEDDDEDDETEDFSDLEDSKFESEEKISSEEEELDEEGEKPKKKKRPAYGIMTIGNYNTLPNKVVEITELPIRVWAKNYDDWLNDILASSRLKNKDQKLTKFFTNKTRNEDDVNAVYFRLEGVERASTKLLRLKRTFALTNMVLTDEKGIPSRYNTVKDILEMFYTKRLPYYETRRVKLLDITRDEIKKLNDKIAFILAIREKKLKVRDIPEEEIMARMGELKLNTKLYGQTSLRGINKNEIDKLLAEKAEKEEYITFLNSVKPEQLWLTDLTEFEDEYYNHYDE